MQLMTFHKVDTDPFVFKPLMLQFSNGGLVFFKEKNQFSKKREMQMDENGHDDHTCVGQSIINTINDTCVQK
jgi:hypothetical protein